MCRLPIWSCDNFSFFVKISAFCDDEITQFYFLPVSCTDSGHGREAWTKLIQKRFEIQSRLHWTAIRRPSHEQREGFSLSILDRRVSIFVAVTATKGFGEGNIAPCRELIEHGF